MSNKEIARAFKLAGQLMELHDENPFKIRSLQNAAFKIERLPAPLEGMSKEEIAAIDGIGKGILSKIDHLLNEGTFEELSSFSKETPEGVVEMLGIKGIGPKKVRVLWKDLGVESPGELLYACHENRLVELKGFGEKTQASIIHAIEYAQANQGKYHYAVIEPIALQLEKDLLQESSVTRLSITGDMRRKSEIIEQIDFVIQLNDKKLFLDFLKQHPILHADTLTDTETSWRILVAGKLPVYFFKADESSFARELFRTTGSKEHVEWVNASLHTEGENFTDESSIYSKLGITMPLPELREALHTEKFKAGFSFPKLVEMKDLKGILHNHTTYSDGAHTLRQMAEYCKESGYEYLGICDHSKSAFYANGLKEDRIAEQHREIDELNTELSPFRIFKGIESDILQDGSLDYEDTVLASFDFIVASVHSGLRMDKEKATQRLIKAIENPYTTILGHPTGRLLLGREGYPIDHKKVIDACATTGVILELNANPYRLDIDWRYIPYALEKGVKISINPDAHRMEGYNDMHYGVCVARKGGLSTSMTFNALGLKAVQEHFSSRKK